MTSTNSIQITPAVEVEIDIVPAVTMQMTTPAIAAVTATRTAHRYSLSLLISRCRLRRSDKIAISRRGKIGARAAALDGVMSQRVSIATDIASS